MLLQCETINNQVKNVFMETDKKHANKNFVLLALGYHLKFLRKCS